MGSFPFEKKEKGKVIAILVCKPKEFANSVCKELQAFCVVTKGAQSQLGRDAGSVSAQAQQSLSGGGKGGRHQVRAPLHDTRFSLCPPGLQPY